MSDIRPAPPAATGGHGFVSLVGAGPGDIGLLTVRGRKRLEEADVVFYDYLAHPLLLEYCPERALKFHVGKRAKNHSVPQEAICDVLVEYAKAGHRVVRLKGGDPYVYGRGGEEGTRLAEEGIAFEVVPGISSVTAVAAYAGIPVTDRRAASSLLVATGHEDPLREDRRVLWERAAQASDTLVVLMGTRRIPTIAAELIEWGRSPDTPAAAISWGTTARQQAVRATLGTLADRIRAEGLSSPSVIVVGDVVSLDPGLRFFERKPLFGLRVGVTRAREQARTMLEALVERGAEPVALPMLAFDKPESFAAVDRAIDALRTDDRSYDSVVFTSVNGVRFFFARLRELGGDSRALAGREVLAIGPATADALLARGIAADTVPDEFIAEGVLRALEAAGPLSARRILLPRAAVARSTLPDAIVAAGGTIDVAPVYQTVPGVPGPEAQATLEAGGLDAVAVTSSSTVHHLVDYLGGAESARERLANTPLAAIGPVTAKTAREYGLGVAVVASTYTSEGLMDALASWWGVQNARSGVVV